MLVPNQTFLIKTGGKTINHYRSLGYNVKPNQEFEVPLEHLMTTSHQKIALTCDGCGKEFHREYRTYIEIKETGSPDYCRKCTTNNKVKKTVQERYGVDNIFQSDVFKEKQKNTLLERYGVANSSQIEDVKIKRKQTFLEHYGVDNPNKCEDIRKKAINTCLERYGYDHPQKVPEIKQRSIQTLISNGNVPTSSQQIEVYNMVKSIFDNKEAILNYACDRSIFDIALFIDENKIDIEYDGWYWHQDTQKDRNRDEHFKLYGWKILRIKSANKIPTKDQLIEAINRLIKNGYSYTEIVLDDWINSVKYRKEENVS